MNNRQEYDLHVLNELIVASGASAHGCVPKPRKEGKESDRHAIACLSLAIRLRAEIAALNGRAAEPNSILAAAFEAMCVAVDSIGETSSHNDPLQARLQTALTDARLSPSIKDGLTRAVAEMRMLDSAAT